MVFIYFFIFLHVRHMINFSSALESTWMFDRWQKATSGMFAAVVRTEDLSWNKQERPLGVMLSDMLWCVSFIDTTYVVLPCKLRFLCKSEDKNVGKLQVPVNGLIPSSLQTPITICAVFCNPLSSSPYLPLPSSCTAPIRNINSVLIQEMEQVQLHVWRLM